MSRTARPEHRSTGIPPASPAALDVSVVVVSFNTRELTLACLRTVREQTASLSYEIIVVDNDSADGSVEAVRREFADVQLIANRLNAGFARANNQGIARARGRYVLLLNSDTEVQDDAIGRTVRFADEHPDVGVVGCRAFQPDGNQQSTMFRYLRLGDVLVNTFLPNRLMRRSRTLGRSRYVGLSRDEVQDVEVVAGCFMLVRREVIQAAGGMDEGFFMYGEEAEWCHRIRQAGWGVRYFPGARILHHGGASTSQRPGQMKLAMAQSQLVFLRKTRGALVAYIANLLMLLRDLPRVLAWGLLTVAPDSEPRKAMTPAAKRFPFHLRSLAGIRDEAHGPQGGV